MNAEVILIQTLSYSAMFYYWTEVCRKCHHLLMEQWDFFFFLKIQQVSVYPLFGNNLYKHSWFFRMSIAPQYRVSYHIKDRLSFAAVQASWNAGTSRPWPSGRAECICEDYPGSEDTDGSYACRAHSQAGLSPSYSFVSWQHDLANSDQTCL